VSTTGTGPSARARCAAKALWNSSNSDSSSAFYVFGGRNSLTTYFSDLYSFDTGTNLFVAGTTSRILFFWSPASGSWSNLPSYTTGVGLTSIAQVGNNQLYIYGGYNGNSLSATFFYNTKSMFPLLLASSLFGYHNMQLDSPRSHTAATWATATSGSANYGSYNTANLEGTKLYVFGGNDNAASFSTLMEGTLNPSTSLLLPPPPNHNTHSLTLSPKALSAYSTGPAAPTGTAIPGGVTTTIYGTGNTTQEVFFAFGGYAYLFEGTVTNAFQAFTMVTNGTPSLYWMSNHSNTHTPPKVAVLPIVTIKALRILSMNANAAVILALVVLHVNVNWTLSLKLCTHLLASIESCSPCINGVGCNCTCFTGWTGPACDGKSTCLFLCIYFLYVCNIQYLNAPIQGSNLYHI